jgi:site-specific DNA recombinase
MIRNATKPPLRIVGYCRTSTDRQEISLADQERKLRAYIEAHDGYELVDLVAAHESAASLKRDGLQRALAILGSGEADALLVLKLDRLCRSLRDLMELVDSYFAHPRRPKVLVSVQDSIDTKSAGGKLVLSV